MADAWPLQRAERLRKRAARRRADGSRGLRARRALRILYRQCFFGRPNHYAREALWQVWLAGPDRQVWDLLRVTGHQRMVFAQAVRPDRPAAERASIGAFCSGQGIVPENAVERALFFLLTGQQVQYRAADPDGSLLAVAYQGADEPVRAAVRQALAGSGDLNLVALVAGTARERMAAISTDEVGYLADQLAARRNWAGLWRLVRELPLVHVRTAMTSFLDGWQPDDARDQLLFRLLSRAGPGEIGEARDALLRPLCIRPAGIVDEYAFSPDGRRLFVETLKWVHGDVESWIGVYDLPATSPAERPGALRERYRVPGLRRIRLLSLGDALLVSGIDEEDRESLVRYSAGEPEIVWYDHAPVVRAHPDGFIAFQWWGEQRLEIHRTGTSAGGHRPLRIIWLDHLGISRSSDNRLIAADAASGRVALYQPPDLWFADTGSGDARVLGRAQPSWLGDHGGGCFITPERLFLACAEDVRLYQVGDGEVRCLAAAELPRCSAPIAIPMRDEVALYDDTGELFYLDTPTLTRVPVPRELTGHRWKGWESPILRAAPDGRCHADLARNIIHVVADPRAALVAALADRPQASLTPADLMKVTTALRDGIGGQAGRAVLEPLAAGLEHRFVAEVALGSGGRGRAGNDDISLSAGR